MLFGVVDGLPVEIAVDHPDPTGIVLVDNVEELVERVFHGSTQVQYFENRQM
jgi:hypothetical protein